MEAQETQEDIEAIYSDPAFVDAVLELLGLSEVQIETPLPEESGEDDVTQRVCRLILLRMKQRHTEHHG
jgi:hypothetical protein